MSFKPSALVRIIGKYFCNPFFNLQYLLFVFLFCTDSYCIYGSVLYRYSFVTNFIIGFLLSITEKLDTFLHAKA